MKILLYICLHIKTVSRRLRIIKPFTLRDMRTLDMRLFVDKHKHTETIEYIFMNTFISYFLFKKNTNFTGK